MTPISQFMQYARHIKGYSANTLQAYESDLRSFAEWLNDNRPGTTWRTLTRADIDDYITHQSSQGMKPATTNRQISAISAIYNYFMRQGYLESNPTRYENRKKLAELVPNTIPMADLRKAYERNQGVAKFMIGILATTGIRLQEMLELRWSDIDFDSCSLKIHGKGNRERVVHTSPKVLEHLEKVRAYARPERPLFYIGQRKARYILYNAVRPFTRAPQVSPHAIRHSYATELAKGGINAVAIAKAMGHKSIETTQRYIDMAQVGAASNSALKLINITA